MPSEIKITDNSGTVKSEFEAACLKALETCGLIAEGYAKRLAVVDTGNLRNSISHKVVEDEKAAYVGTPVDYGVYVEMGTGKYIPGGSPPWVYQDDQGNWHKTSGMPPRPFVKPSVSDHGEEYQDIIKSALKGK